MARMKLFFVGFVLIFLTGSCRRTATLAEFKSYVADPENGLQRKKELSGLVFNMSYLPPEILREYNKETNTSLYDYFVLRISAPSSGKPVIKSRSEDQDDYFNKLYYVQTKLQKDFVAEVNGVERPCVLLDYEEDHNILRDMKVVLVFDRSDKSGDIVIRYEDNLFGQGLINFRFKKEDLQSIPYLKI